MSISQPHDPKWVVLYFKITSYVNNLNLGHVNYAMLCELTLLPVRFAASIAPERLLSTVRHRVALQITGRCASVIALVTLVWLFSCVVPHCVIFQMTSCNTGKLAHCASVGLFPRVGSFVLLQMV